MDHFSVCSANLILRGTGEHKLLTYTNASTAVVNVLLSIALIRPYGLLGVALGTIIPVGVAAALVLYPAACRRVGLPLGRPLAQAIWPAIWPGGLMVGSIWWSARSFPPTHLFEVGLHFAAGAVVYLGLFVILAIGPEERRLYWTKLRTLVRAR